MVLNLEIREEVSFKLEHEPRQRSRVVLLEGVSRRFGLWELQRLDLGTSSCLCGGEPLTDLEHSRDMLMPRK